MSTETWVYFDSITGSDATGQINDDQKPFKTILAGYTAAKSQIGPTAELNLILQQGDFDMPNLNSGWNFFYISDQNGGTTLTVEGTNTFRVAIFDTDITIKLSHNNFFGINYSGLFQFKEGNTMTIEYTPGRVSSNNSVFNGTSDSSIIIEGNVNFAMNGHPLPQFILTDGDIDSTFPDAICKGISFNNEHGFIESDGDSIIIDNSTKTGGISSLIQIEISDGAFSSPFQYVLGAITTIVSYQNVNIRVEPSNTSGTAVTFIAVAIKSASLSKRVPKGVSKVCIERQINFNNTTINFQPLIPEDKFFLTNIDDFTAITTDLINVDLPPVAQMDFTPENNAALYTVSHDYSSINFSGAFISQPKIITKNFTHQLYDGMLFYIDASHGNILINLINDIPGRIIIYKRIDKTNNSVTIRSPNRFDGYKKDLELYSSNRKNRDRCGKTGITVGYFDKGRWLILSKVH